MIEKLSTIFNLSFVKTPSAPSETTKPENSSESSREILNKSPDARTISIPSTQSDKTGLLLPEPCVPVSTAPATVISPRDAVLNKAQPLFSRYLHTSAYCIPAGTNANLFVVSISISLLRFLKKIVKEKSKYKIFININKKQTYFYVRSIFENNLKNLLAAIAIISIYKDTQKLDKNIFFDYEIAKGRGDITKIKFNKKNIYIVDESYNSNPLSLKSAIKNFDELKIDNSKKKLILGDMLELGNYSKKLHIEAGKDINKTSLKNINVVGKHILYTYKNLDKHRRGVTLKDKSKIIDLIKNDLNNNDYLMIKGSNSTGLNNLVNKLKTGKFNAL